MTKKTQQWLSSCLRIRMSILLDTDAPFYMIMDLLEISIELGQYSEALTMCAGIDTSDMPIHELEDLKKIRNEALCQLFPDVMDQLEYLKQINNN